MVLCRTASERHHSDAVLVACLAALRKLCSSSTPHTASLQSLCKSSQSASSTAGNNNDKTTSLNGVAEIDSDLKELIQPNLMESFVLCSGLDESVV